MTGDVGQIGNNGRRCLYAETLEAYKLLDGIGDPEIKRAAIERNRISCECGGDCVYEGEQRGKV